MLRDPGSDPTARAFAHRQRRALARSPAALHGVQASAVDLIAGGLTGIPALRQLIAGVQASPPSLELGDPPVLDDIESLIDELDQAGHGVVMTMGNGGVGKTTIAAAIAVALADREHQITLSTTDPAAHVADALADETLRGLRVQRIDPHAETARYTAEVLAAAGDLDAHGRALLAEDLRSPCTEEVAVFRAFARTIDDATDAIVVLDTDPTGHTLLLLDAAHSYQREIQRTNANVPDAVRQDLVVHPASLVPMQ